MRANVLLPRTQQIQDDQPQQAILYTLLIPGAADGSQPDLLGQVQELVLAEFGGVTTLAQGNRRLHRGCGLRPAGQSTPTSCGPGNRRLHQCVAPAGRRAETWFRELAAELARQAGCLEIFLLKQPVSVLPRL